MQAQDVVVVGRIGAPYGVQGWVRVSSFTEPAANLADYGPWLLETDAGWQVRQPLERKPHKQGYVVRFADVTDREAAARLAGKHIAIARGGLPELEPDEYYWRDLEGLVVWNRGQRLGVVDHLIDTGANPVLVVRGEAADATESTETLIPFVDQFVQHVDLAGNRIDVIWIGWDEAD